MAYDVLSLGLFMVLCIAMGVALAMTAIGVICISGKKGILGRISKEKEGSKLQSIIELIGAVSIVCIALVLFEVHSR